MAKRTITYFYSTHSAYAYIGSTRLMEICAAHECRLVHRPFELSPVVQHAKGPSFPKRSQAHIDYFFGREIERWAEYRAVPIISFRPTYHDNALTLSSGMLIAAEMQGHEIDALAHAFLQAHWVDDIDLMDRAALSDATQSVGIDPKPLLERAMSLDVQAVFEKNTQDAMALNLFGSPSYILDGDIFYGQDHLELVEHALTTPFKAPGFRNPPVTRE